MDDDAVDELAREMYAAALVVEGWGEDGANRRASRQCPDTYYAIAEQMLAPSGESR